MKIEIGTQGWFTSGMGLDQRRQRAKVVHLWSETCVNLLCEDGSQPSSVLIWQPGCGGYYFKPDQVDEIEREIQAKGLTAARVTPADVESNIVSEHYFRASDGVNGAAWLAAMDDNGDVNAYAAPIPDVSLTLLTFCVLRLRNGFTVTGESACASPENFDEELGRKIARQNAVDKVWPLMGYELRSRLAAAAQTAVTDDLVNRFLTWPVPANVYPDGTPGQLGRTGTNLLSAPEARQMLEHVLHKG